MGEEENKHEPKEEPGELPKWEPVGGGVINTVVGVFAVSLLLAILAVLFRHYFSFSRGTVNLLLMLLAGICVGGWFAFHYLRDRYWEKRMRAEKQWKCLKCGYDLWGTPERCPECGAASPFGEYLKKKPVDKAIYEGDLRPQPRGDKLPPRTGQRVEDVEKSWPEFDAHSRREEPTNDHE